MVKINCLGSCVSRVSLLRGGCEGHDVYNGDAEKIKLEYFLDKHNISLAMLPPPPDLSREILESISAEELWDKSRLRSMRQAILKDTVPMLLSSDAKYIVMDFYDFHNSFLTYKTTAFATQAGEFLRTKVFRERQNEFVLMKSLFEFPKWTFYPLVDLFFEKISSKYDSDHIILNRFRSNTYGLCKNGDIALLPDELKQDYQSNDKYNDACRELEDYVIEKYNPYVIDLSKFFMSDENHWSTFHGAHYEKEFYRETYRQILAVIHNKTNRRYFDVPDFLNCNREEYELDKKRNLNIEQVFSVMKSLLDNNDPLWMNFLDKLYAKIPTDKRLQKYLLLYCDTMLNHIEN